jgi:UDPglucose 6-dehydrogenase
VTYGTRPRRITVIGTGYVGLTVGACFSALDHSVTCVDTDARKIRDLRAGLVGIHEPGLSELVLAGLSDGQLSFGLSARQAVGLADIVFLCLPTPPGADGAADISAVEAVAADIADVLPSDCVVVTKSTVPVGTGALLTEILARPDVPVVANPEFLREGHAVDDFFRPDRIVVGSGNRRAAEKIAALYAPLVSSVVITDTASAELAKYVSNCFLAIKLSYVNAVSELCEKTGADVTDVLDAMGRDNRIGPAFLGPGPGWGGSCLPKDVRALAWTARAAGVGFPLLPAAIETNDAQPGRVMEKVRSAVGGRLDGTRIGLLGLAFKAGTGDLRDSPALAVARQLAAQGAILTGYDPQVRHDVEAVTVVDNPYLVARQADALVVLTEWPEFRSLDWPYIAELMDCPVVIDTRNHLDREEIASAGLHWHGTGTARTAVRRPVPAGARTTRSYA